jgi:RNA polymerase sigma-70 factor (ECF subfamily)
MSADDRAPELPEHFFRHEFGRLVAVLSRRFGVGRLELCEDAAQTALMRALEAWSRGEVPRDRGAWLHRVASNHVLDALRRERPSAAVAEELPDESVPEPIRLESEVNDDLLRMLFVCADPAISRESQLALALKTLCGFGTEEIALRLFQSVESVHKRLQRARAELRERAAELDTPRLDELAERLPSVLQMLYLLFNEGYGSAQPDTLIRRELCEEAVRLAHVLADHPIGATPETEALLALMHLHAARFDARLDGSGGLLLLEEQDRSLWDRELIGAGLDHLQRSTGAVSRYHLEAAIAAEHCLATSFAATRWDAITRLYETLEQIAPSPLNTLNRAIALAEWKGLDAALAVLEALRPPAWLLAYYLWDATLGELYRRRGDHDRAIAHLTRALESAPTHAEKNLIEKRLRACTA